MIGFRVSAAAALVGSLAVAAAPLSAQEPLQVVTTLPTYAAIAREITGNLAEVTPIARGDEDPHFVNPRPSFARLLQGADLFVSTGLDLELWVPGLLERASNARVVEGAPGHVVAYAGVDLLDIPASVSRAGGDVHVFGNPHVHTDPINGIQVGRNILAGLIRVDPDHTAEYEKRAREFETRLLRRTFGEDLVEILGEETLLTLASSRQFWSFAESQTYEGKPLTDFVGGWLQLALPFRGERMACYHKNWAYFGARFDVECAIYVEPKPGIPPSPGHVRDVIAFIQDNQIPVLFAANYFGARRVEQVASRAGAQAIVVPEHVDGLPEVRTYFDLFDSWVSCLAEAFGGNVPPCRR
jgi:ABC-type Zn uptake system ZnuABC Zn-binding protein ZnuA